MTDAVMLFAFMILNIVLVALCILLGLAGKAG